MEVSKFVKSKENKQRTLSNSEKVLVLSVAKCVDICIINNRLDLVETFIKECKLLNNK